jgi:hypothetical protein
MATTFVELTGDGNATKPFAFPSIQESDIKVKVDEVLKSSGTHYNITGYTTTGGGNVVFTSGNIPTSPSVIFIYRDTDVDSAKATYTAGASVKAGDLNANHEQVLFALQEEQNQLERIGDIKDGAIDSAKIKDDTIVNADINSAAAIAGTKISPNFGSQNIVTSGTVDGRDVSVDGAKLDDIEDNATRDQTASEIKTLLQSDKLTVNEIDNDSITYAKIQNVSATDRVLGRDSSGAGDIEEITPANLRTMINVEDGATADQTGAEIKSAYEGESDTNAFTDAEKLKLGNLGSLNALSDVDTAGVADNKILKYDSSVSKFVIADDGGGGGGGGSSTFTGLSDTPANFGSSAGKVLKVNSGETALEFGDLTTSFTELSDTPSSLSGQGGKAVKVNSGGTALEFGTINTDLELDGSPSLSANLDVNGFSILTNTTNGSIQLVPNGTGNVTISGAGGNDGTLQLNCSANSHGVKIKSPPHSAGASYTLTLPEADGTQGTFLKTDGSGTLAFGSTMYEYTSGTNGYGWEVGDIIIEGTPDTGESTSSANVIHWDKSTKTLDIGSQITTKFGFGQITQKDSADTTNQAVAGNSTIISNTAANKDILISPGIGHLSIGADNVHSEVAKFQPPVNGANQDGYVELKWAHQAGSSAVQRLLTTSTGLTLTGHVIPAADSTYDIGTTSVRFGNIYADTLYGDGSNLTGVTPTVANGCIYENNTEITANFTTSTTKNSMSAGPITIANNVTLTIPNNSVYTIV